MAVQAGDQGSERGDLNGATSLNESLSSDAMSEADIDDLAARLDGIDVPDRMTLEAVDGFFCALIASPELVTPSVYLPVIFGGEEGLSAIFLAQGEGQVTLSLLMRYWNLIAADFTKDAVHLPYVLEVPAAGVPGQAWARGFMRGTRLAPLGWDELFTSDDEGDVVIIPLLAGEVDPEWPKEPLTKEKELDLLKTVAVGAGRAYRYFAEARSEFADDAIDEDLALGDDEYYPETFVRAEPKIGRNEPCPCGSGKKYKKCCGAPS